MKSRVSTIFKLAVVTLVATLLQSCDSTLNIERPQNFLKYIGRDGDQTGIDFVTDDEGNIYILGSTTSTSDGTQVYLVKTDPNGIVQWEQTFGDAGEEIPKDIERLTNGNLAVVADRIDISTGEKDFLILLVNQEDGTLLQAPRIYGETGVVEVSNTVAQTLSGGFIVAAYKENSGGFKVGQLVRFNSSLQVDTATFKPKIELRKADDIGSTGYDVVPMRIVQTKYSATTGDEEFYTFGYTNSTFGGDDNPDYNFFATVSNFQNDVLRPFVIPGADANSDERLTDARQIPAEAGGGWIMTGYTSQAGVNQQDLYMLRLIPDLLPVTEISDPTKYMRGSAITLTSGLSSVSSNGASVYPSPSRNILILGEQNTSGTSDIYLTGVRQSPQDFSWSNIWAEPRTGEVFGGEGNDFAGKVEETSDGSILVLGTMTLGDVTGQTKIVLMRLDSEGMLGK